MSNFKYNMAELAKAAEFNAGKAVKKYKNRQAFFNILTSFVDDSQRFMHSFNPVVVIYNDAVRTSFAHKLKEMKGILNQLEMGFSDAELKELEDAALKKNEKELSGKLRKFYSKLSLIIIRIESARVDSSSEDTSLEEYDMSELLKIKDLEADNAVKNFSSNKEYYSRLTVFVEDMSKFISSYNPIVVLYSEDVRNEFTTELTRLKNERKLLETNFFDAGIRSLEVALSSNSEKVFSDGLTNLIAKTRIFNDLLDGARNPSRLYDMDDLSKIKELNIKKIANDKKSRRIYFNLLTEFADKRYKQLISYNPIVVMFEDEMRRDFSHALNTLNSMLISIEMRNVDTEIKNIENALLNRDIKAFSDELLKFNAKIEILAKNIQAASIEKGDAEEFDDKQADKRKEYIKKLNAFIKDSDKFLEKYNRKQDTCSKDVCDEINIGLSEIKRIVTSLESMFIK